MWTSPSAELPYDLLLELALSPLTESELMKELLELQKLFTTERKVDFSQYHLDEKKVSSYFLFHFPSNLPKFDFLLEQLSTHAKEQLYQNDFYDIGSGPGTYSFAFLRHAPKDYTGTVHLVDHSELMLKQARQLLTLAFPDQKIEYHQKFSKELLQRKNSTLFFGHSLNEMPGDVRRFYFNSFLGSMLLWIEPGTPAVFQTLMLEREKLISQGFMPLFPCAASTACPALQREGEWCHQVVKAQQPPWLERLSQKMQMDRRSLPMMAHVYSRQTDGELASTKKARLVRVKPATKYSFEWEVCLLQGHSLQWLKVSLPFKKLTKAEVKSFEKISVGIEIDLEFEKELNADYFRVNLVR